MLVTCTNLKVQQLFLSQDLERNWFEFDDEMIILDFHACLQNTQLFFMPAKKWCKTDSIDFNVLIFDQEKSKENVKVIR